MKSGAFVPRKSKMFLSHQELVSLTGKKQKAAQVRALRSMCIEHRVRPDGSVAVLLSHINNIFGGPKEPVQKKSERVPNFAALNDIKPQRTNPKSHQ